MSEPENFLKRWSRRKREAGDESPPAPGDTSAEQAVRVATNEKAASSGASKADASKKESEPFDVSTLPSIESIGANSDVRAFMQQGVPLELRHAALRRAWSTDLEIRDFIGLVENGWDFNDPHGVPGFGPLPEGTDIKSLLAQAIGSPQPDTVAPADEPERVAEAQNNPEYNRMPVLDQPAPPPVADTSPELEPAASEENSLQRDESYDESYIAMQNESEADSGPPLRRRGHGGALPK